MEHTGKRKTPPESEDSTQGKFQDPRFSPSILATLLSNAPESTHSVSPRAPTKPSWFDPFHAYRDSNPPVPPTIPIPSHTTASPEPSQPLPKRPRTAYISTTSTAAFMPLPALPPRTISTIPDQTAIASIPRPASLPARPSTIVPPHNQLPASQLPSQVLPASNGIIPLPPQRLIPRSDARPAFPEFHADKLSIRDIVPGLLAHLPWNGASWSRHPVLVLSFHPATGYANCLKATSFQDRPGAIAAKVAEFETQEDKDRFLAGFVLVEDGRTPPHNGYPVLRLEEGWLVKTTYVDVRRGSMECVHFSELRRLRSGGVFLTPRIRRADVEALRLDLANGRYA